LFVTPFDATTLTVAGTAVPLQQDVAMGGFSGAAQMAWSNTGSLVFSPGASQDRAVVWVDRQGRSERTPLPPRPYQTGSSQMRVSPDGTRVALTIFSEGNSGGSGDIWLWEIARGTLTRLSFTSRSASPVWTPDGKRVCYASERSLLCQAADGSGHPQPMFNVSGPFAFNGLGPITSDGRSILIARPHRQDSLSESDIMIAEMGSAGEMRPLIQTPANETEPSISPDGKWIAYTSGESGRDEVFVRPFPDVDQGRWQISSDGGIRPTWAPTGRELFYLQSASAGFGNPTALVSVPVQPGPTFSSGRPAVVTKLPAGAGSGFAVAPDGRFLFNVPATFDAAQAARAQIVVVQNWFTELQQRVPTR